MGTLRRRLAVLRHAENLYGLVGEDLSAPDERQDWLHELRDRREFLRRGFKMLAFNGIAGDYAEFGCNGAWTFRMAHNAARSAGHAAHLWAFDSFAGLPTAADQRDEHPQWQAGTMATEEADFRARCAGGGVPPSAYTMVPGFYEDSLRDDAPGPRPTSVAFAYIDCDLYSSTVDVLRFLVPRIGHGTLLAFDDYFCYSAMAASGERVALQELTDAHPHLGLLPYQAFGWHGMSFIVEAGAAPRA